MDEWLSHTVTAVFGLFAGSLPAFILKRRQQTTDEWQSMVGDLRQRIVSLEMSIDRLHAEHVQCLQIQSELKAKIAMLERSLELKRDI